MTEAAAGVLPDRPAFPFVTPPSRNGPYRDADIRGAMVARSGDGPGWQRARATVRPGGRGRTLLVVYLVDLDGATITRSAAEPADGHGAAAVGAWVDDPDPEPHRELAADIDLPLPSGVEPERLRQGRVQFSLFDERMTEVARATVRLPSSGRSSGSTNSPGRPERSR